MQHVLSILLCSFLVAVARALPLESRDIASSLLSTLSFYEQYAAAAYCRDNNIPGSSTTISCSSGNCPLVQSAGATSVLEFQNEGPADATGYVAVDNTNKLIVISFRGSTSLSNWIGNINLVLVPTDICSSCFVHAGFLESWQASKGVIAPVLAKAVSDHPGYSIIATGHSLGGAIATLAAADLRKQGYTVGLYTYGSPMVGNDPFAKFVTNQSGGNFRVTHSTDVVPKLPGYLLGYRHVSPEYWITSGDNVPVTTSAVQVSTGTLNLKGNQGQLDSSIDAHSWYFNQIAQCQPGGFELRKRDLEEDIDVLSYTIVERA